MTNETYNRLASAIRLALGTGLAVMMTTSPVANAAEEEDAAELQRVQVTGSRLNKLDMETASPVTTVTRDDITRLGYDSVGQVIQSLPSTNGSPTNTYVNNGGNGSARPDLRGLGSGRTLVLINGRRSNFATDLNSIPVAMVERIEILKDGASAVYGADAVAGVINIITRSDFEGLEATVQYSNWLDGSGATKRASITSGSTSRNGYFMFGADWTEQEGIFQGDMSDNVLFDWDHAVNDEDGLISRGFVLDGPNPTVGRLGSSSIPGGRFNVNGTTMTLAFTESGGQRTYAPGTSASDFRPFDFDRDQYNYAPVNYIQTPNERLGLFFEGGRDLSDSIRMYAEGGSQHRKSAQILAPLPYFSIFDPGYEVSPGTVGIPANNVYNPFGVAVDDVRRRMVETGGRHFRQDVNMYRLVVGLEGEINHAWSWDVNYNISRTTRSDTDFGQFAGARLTNAMGPSFDNDPGAGFDPVCGIDPDGTPGTGDEEIVAGCVPFNFFGGPGSITPEMLDYVSVAVNDTTRSQTSIWNGSVNGDIFDMPGGAAQLAAGVEMRREKTEFVPDSSKVLGQVTGNVGEGLKGSKAIDSVYGELYLPILSGSEFADLLDITLGVRRDDFNTFGSQTSSQVNFRWKPTHNFLVRATWGQSFREPTLSALFSGQSDSFPTADDPCSIEEWDSLSADAQARCIGQGVPDGGWDQSSEPQLRAAVGGNPNLGPEEGESYTFGLGFSPLPDLSFTIDYWNVELENTISALTAQAVMDKCIRDGVLELCDDISRRPDGGINRVTALADNLGAMVARGLDFSVDYRHSAFGGDMAHQFIATQLLERESQAAPGDPFVEQDGWFDVVIGGNFDEAAFPKTRATYRNDWTMNNFGVSASVEYISSIKDPVVLTTPQSYDVGNVVYLDLSTSWQFLPGTVVRFGVTNVTDEEAPYVPSGFNAGTEPRLYRMMGTGYFLNLTTTF